jgi:hypothetical protein
VLVAFVVVAELAFGAASAVAAVVVVAIVVALVAALAGAAHVGHFEHSVPGVAVEVQFGTCIASAAFADAAGLVVPSWASCNAFLVD